MAVADVKLSEIIFWGEINEDKSKTPTKWDHDILLNVSNAGKVSPVEDIFPIVGIILDEDPDNISKEMLYDGVDEYRAAGKKEYVEVAKGLNYTIVKIYNCGQNLDEIAGRLKSAGIKEQKPSWDIEIPDRPKRVNENELKKLRFKYSDDAQERDEKLGKRATLNSILRGVITGIVSIAVISFIIYEGFVTKYQNVTPPTENFIAKKGTLLGYDAGGTLALFAFADPVDELGVDEHAILYIPEGVETTNKIVVEKAVDSLGNVLYEKGARQVEFTPPIEGYTYAKANLFKYDTYQHKDDAGWAQYGVLGTGKATKIIVRGRIVEMEDDGYYVSLGSGYAKLGSFEEDESLMFYNTLADAESYITAKFSMETGRPVYLYGQIEETFTPREGRNSKDKKLFAFRATYARFTAR